MRALLFDLRHAEKAARDLPWLPNATKKHMVMINMGLAVLALIVEFPAAAATDGLLMALAWAASIFFGARAIWVLLESFND